MVTQASTAHITGYEHAGVNASVSRSQCTVCVFRSHCLPADLGDGALERFELQVRRQSYPIRAGQIVVSQGDAIESMYAIRAGSLKAIVNEIDGSERILAFRFPGSIAGLAEFHGTHWAHSFVTLEDSWLCAIPFHAIDDTLRPHLVHLMSDRLGREYQSLLVLAANSGPRKVAWFLLELSALFASLGRSATAIHLPMHYIDVASYLGMRQESLSRTLARLQKARVIDKRGKALRITNIEALREVRSTGAI
ncbi:Crp/Fnr family transcriptional regulator [Salinisphaera sp. SWV1]|uniref:Crp/Fnr family transcriptional regulator n=1 Tax=Salinisphaera sp. SWV1 TaxID=3454139 RepID=UPI003F8528DD